MKVFVSWSGAQANIVATELRGWLPKVLAGRVTPFVSSEDIAKGQRGLNVIATELEESAFGIVIMTPENQQSAWINFEAGALGKSLADGHVAPFLLGMNDAEIVGPLKQFQATVAADPVGVLALMKSINAATADPLPESTVSDLFGMHWPSFEAALARALAVAPNAPSPKRASDDVLDEILSTVRALVRDSVRQPILSDSLVGSLVGVITGIVGGTQMTFEVDSTSDGVPRLTARMPRNSNFNHLSDEQAGLLRELSVSEGITVRFVGGSGDVSFAPTGIEGRIAPGATARERAAGEARRNHPSGKG